MTTTLTRPNTPPARSAELLLAHAHLRLGSLALARTELETLAGMGKLDSLGLVDLAEVRWRTGDLAGAGEAAAVALAWRRGTRGRPSDRGRGGGLARSPERIAPARGAGDGLRARLDRRDLRRHAAVRGVAARCRRAATDRADAVRSGLRRTRQEGEQRGSGGEGRQRGPGGSGRRPGACARTDDARPVGRRPAGGAGRARSPRAGPRARGWSNGSRRGQVQRGGPALRARLYGSPRRWPRPSSRRPQAHARPTCSSSAAMRTGWPATRTRPGRHTLQRRAAACPSVGAGRASGRPPPRPARRSGPMGRTGPTRRRGRRRRRTRSRRA